MRDVVGVSARDARLFMAFDGRRKLVHAEGGFRPMLFDLRDDPDELHDLGADPAHAEDRGRMHDHLARWGRRMAQRVTRSDAQIEAMRGASQRRGVVLGLWDGSRGLARSHRPLPRPAPRRGS